MSKGRVGADLKGINKGILQQIDGQTFNLIEKEYNLYKCKKDYEQQKNNTIKYLNQYRS